MRKKPNLIWQSPATLFHQRSRKSFTTYLHSFGTVGLAMMFGWLITIGGLFANCFGYSTIPNWIWVIIGYVMLLLAPFFAFKKVWDENKSLSIKYNDPDLILEFPSVEYIATKAIWVAKIALRHTGNRSIASTEARILAMSPIDKDVQDECGGLFPVYIVPRGKQLWPFELHSQPAHEWIDVAFLYRGSRDLHVADVPDGPAILPLAAYVLIIQVCGHNARATIGAYRLGYVEKDSDFEGETETELVFEQFTTPIRDVLGDGHPLAKEFDQKIHPSVASAN